MSSDVVSDKRTTTHFPKLALLAHSVSGALHASRDMDGLFMIIEYYRVSGAQRTLTVARVQSIYVACSTTDFLSMDIDMISGGSCKLSRAAPCMFSVRSDVVSAT